MFLIQFVNPNIIGLLAKKWQKNVFRGIKNKFVYSDLISTNMVNFLEYLLNRGLGNQLF